MTAATISFRLEYLNQAKTVFLAHEILINAEYGFETSNLVAGAVAGSTAC